MALELIFGGGPGGNLIKKNDQAIPAFVISVTTDRRYFETFWNAVD